jgi:hypothetical protein
MLADSYCRPAGRRTETTVTSKIGWQPTPWAVDTRFSYVFGYVSDRWSVDYRNLPYVTLQGYAPTVDSQIYQGCKFDPNLVYGRMLAKVGNGAWFAVSAGSPFRPPASGRLYLRIHDADPCLVDNDGAIAVNFKAAT